MGRFGAVYLAFERPDWHLHAACRGMGADLFHPKTVNGRPTKANHERIAETKAVCERCPVAAECLAAVRHLSPKADLASGAIRGGLTASERHPDTIAVKRRAVIEARARKAGVA